jgi:DNA polymerase-3 subunit delta
MLYIIKHREVFMGVPEQNFLRYYMKLNSSQLESWKKNNNINDIKFALIYGPDEGGVEISARSIAKSFANGNEVQLNKFDFKAIKGDFSLLVDELSSVSLFGEQKVIVVADCPQTLPKEMLEYLSKANFTAKLILKSAELKPTSNLRKLAETTKDALSIACYKEDLRQIESYIRSFLEERGAKFESYVIPVLAQIMPSNKLFIANELEKLITYKMGEVITLESVEDIISDSQEVGLDDLCVAVALKQKAKTLKLIERAANTDTSFMLILRVLQRYFIRVLEVLSYIEAGMSVEISVGKLAPPVFYKQKDNMIKVCRAVRKEKILALNEDLVKLELECKKKPLDQYMLIGNYLNL